MGTNYPRGRSHRGRPRLVNKLPQRSEVEVDRLARIRRKHNLVTEKMYDKLAQLVVRKGVNVQKDQPVVIRAHVQDAAFVKKIPVVTI